MSTKTTTQVSLSHVVRVHATNITGLGATQLVMSLLPAIERVAKYPTRTFYLPARGALSDYHAVAPSTSVVRRKRRLPNAVSRALECTLFAGQFEGEGGLLVLGDIPLRCKGRQTVFVQTPLLTAAATSSRKLGAIKYVISRALFRLNAKYASAFIVQTEAMKDALLDTYPEVFGRVHVIPQPPPEWLVGARLKRTAPISSASDGLDLFYPAASYPHKNHQLLSHIVAANGKRWPISSLTLTLDQNMHPNSGLEWIKCVGRLGPQHVLRLYSTTDGLLFLSRAESLGFPLLEAMAIGLPVICPDLPYARVLCGDQGIYFDPTVIESLHAAVTELRDRLRAGWWPDWAAAMKAIPKSWGAVAEAMLRITAGPAY